MGNSQCHGWCVLGGLEFACKEKTTRFAGAYSPHYFELGVMLGQHHATLHVQDANKDMGNSGHDLEADWDGTRRCFHLNWGC
jgi:hypothetical protein